MRRPASAPAAAPLLLDTHALLWLARRERLAPGALAAVASAQGAGVLYASPISAWELGLAERKANNRPALDAAAGAWFRGALAALGARLATITPAVAAEAAGVPTVYGRGDPGDCFLIATARARRLTLVTRDAAILRLAAASPRYLRVLAC